MTQVEARERVSWALFALTIVRRRSLPIWVLRHIKRCLGLLPHEDRPALTLADSEFPRDQDERCD